MLAQNRTYGLSNRASGTSLLETIIAFFLLTAASVVVISLYHTALRRTTAVQTSATARLIAEKNLSSLRARLTESDYSSLSPSDLQSTFSDVDSPQFTVTVEAEWADLTNPSSALAVGLAADQLHTLDRSCMKVQVTVSWDNGRKSYRLLSLVEEPSTELQSLRIVGDLSPLSPNGQRELRAEGVDSNGDVITNLRYIWWLEPITGNGTLTSLNGGRVNLEHKTRGYDGTEFTQAGTVRLVVQAKYRGRLVTETSGEIVLNV